MNRLDNLIATYCATMRPHLRWATSKETALRALQRDLGHWTIADLTQPKLVRWAMERPGKPSSLRILLPTLGAVLRTSRDLWQINVNPAAPASALRALELSGIVPRVASRSRRVTDPELAEIRAAWFGPVPPQILDVLVNTAMRSGELTRLLWDDLDTNARTVMIRDRKHPTQRHGNNQIVPLIGTAWLATTAQRRRSARIWPHHQEQLSRTFRTASERAGLSDIRLHDLRHEAISRRFDAGWSIPQVAALSGHKSWANLKRYTHITPETLHQLAQ